MDDDDDKLGQDHITPSFGDLSSLCDPHSKKSDSSGCDDSFELGSHAL